MLLAYITRDMPPPHYTSRTTVHSAYDVSRQSVSIFTALYGMQTRSSDENSVCPSVRPSVCQTRAL